MERNGKTKIKNPLNRRYLRELKGDIGKYLVIFLLMVMSIAEVSGFLVADESMIRAYDESFEKYNIEYGHFETDTELSPGQISKIEKEGVTLYQNYYVEVQTDKGSTLRIFPMRKEVDLADLMSGSFPDETGEIGIDRMYAENNGIKTGDTVKSAGGNRSWTVTGYVALSDYSCLFQNNNDSMFDALSFGVGVVTDEDFASFSRSAVHYNYSWLYDRVPEDTAEEKEAAESLLKKINSVAPLEDYVPRYLNQAINFTGEDMGSDRAMMMVLLYIIIAILGFVFAVTISNTIAKEANVIGTLRASGYTRGELVRHYMVMPLAVTLVSAAAGNILGYTVMRGVNADLYYGSYSLPTYRTVWSADAFVETTLIPVVIMAAITFLILERKLKISPLNFLRGELKARSRGRAFRLPHKMRIFSKYRIRVLFQNLPNFAVLFAGILFADVLLMFGLALPLTLSHYQETVQDNMICRYQYILSAPASMERDEDTNVIGSMVDTLLFYSGTDTDTPGAEKFSVKTLKTTGDDGRIEEDVTLYGIVDDSEYIKTPMKKGDIYVSAAYADKYGLEKGSSITLKEEYEDDEYTFSVTGIYDYTGALAVFMPIDDLNSIFGYGSGFFAGYFSNEKISDIEPEYIGTVIDAGTLTKISRQLDVSMGGFMSVIDVFAVIMFMILVYLLTKTIIEKNAQSISMSKILGYTNGEIGRLYLIPTTAAAVIMLIAAIPIVKVMIEAIYRYYLYTSMAGYMPVYMDAALYLKMFFMGFGVYLAVMVLEMRRIKKVPMDMVLKTIE